MRWDNAESSPIADLRDAIKKVRESGHKPLAPTYLFVPDSFRDLPEDELQEALDHVACVTGRRPQLLIFPDGEQRRCTRE